MAELWADAETLTGDSGSIAYTANDANEQWFQLSATPGRFYTFTTNNPDGTTVELYEGDGPPWAGINYIAQGWYYPLNFTAQPDLSYVIATYPYGLDGVLTWTSVVQTPGWSDWITMDYMPTFASAVSMHTVEDYDGTNTLDSDAVYPAQGRAEMWWESVFRDTEMGGHLNSGHLAEVTYTADPASWADYRVWFPDELSRLIEGNDYIVRPDRTGTEDDAYIELENGGAGNALDGWNMPASAHVQWQPIYGYYDASEYPDYYDNHGFPNGSHLRILLNNTLLLQDTQAAQDADPSIFMPAAWTYTNPDLSGHLPDPGSTLSVTLTAIDPNYYVRPTPPEYPTAMISPYQVQAYVTFPNKPYARVRTARFRYWIPGKVPINQWAQRRDGLGRGGVPMGRGNGTRQASNAARGTY